jgi:biotin carboxyl carrier protein
MVYEVMVNARKRRLELDREGEGWKCQLDGREIRIDVASPHADIVSLLIDGHSYEITRERGARGEHIWIGNQRYPSEVRDPKSWRSRRPATGDESGPKQLLAAMTGKVVRILVREKEQVEAGQGVLAVEAMKMQNEIKSPKRGVIQKILVAQGSTVHAGDVLAVVE